MREGESTSDKNKDQEPAAAGKRTRARQRQHLSRPRSRVSRVLRSTVKRLQPTKPVGGQGQRQHLSSRPPTNAHISRRPTIAHVSFYAALTIVCSSRACAQWCERPKS